MVISGIHLNRRTILFGERTSVIGRHMVRVLAVICRLTRLAVCTSTIRPLPRPLPQMVTRTALNFSTIFFFRRGSLAFTSRLPCVLFRLLCVFFSYLLRLFLSEFLRLPLCEFLCLALRNLLSGFLRQEFCRTFGTVFDSFTRRTQARDKIRQGRTAGNRSLCRITFRRVYQPICTVEYGPDFGNCAKNVQSSVDVADGLGQPAGFRRSFRHNGRIC